MPQTEHWKKDEAVCVHDGTGRGRMKRWFFRKRFRETV